MKLLELSLISALKAFKDDPNMCRYLLQKSELTASSELITRIPNMISLPYNNPVSYYYNHGLKYHTQKQKPEDFCYACYDNSYNTGAISRMYFENLGKEMIREIGLDSFEGLHNAAHTYRHQNY